MTFKVIQNQ